MKTFIAANSKAILIGKYMAAYAAARHARAECKVMKITVEREKADRPPMYSPEGSLEWHERNVACVESVFRALLLHKVRAEKYEKKLRHELLEAGLSESDVVEVRNEVVW